MKLDEIPQDDSILEGHRRACYAQDGKGRYAIGTSRGWTVEAIANRQAVAKPIKPAPTTTTSGMP